MICPTALSSMPFTFMEGDVQREVAHTAEIDIQELPEGEIGEYFTVLQRSAEADAGSRP